MIISVQEVSVIHVRINFVTILLPLNLEVTPENNQW